MNDHEAATVDERTVAIRAEQMIRGYGARAVEIARSQADDARRRSDVRALAIWHRVIAAIEAAPRR